MHRLLPNPEPRIEDTIIALTLAGEIQILVVEIYLCFGLVDHLPEVSVEHFLVQWGRGLADWFGISALGFGFELGEGVSSEWMRTCLWF